MHSSTIVSISHATREITHEARLQYRWVGSTIAIRGLGASVAGAGAAVSESANYSERVLSVLPEPGVIAFLIKIVVVASIDTVRTLLTRRPC